MILHTVSFRWREGVTDDDVAALTDALGEMATRIPHLRSYVAAPNLRLRPGGADYGVVAIVDDAAALDAYLDHPAHIAVFKSRIERMLGERTATQLPIETGSLT
ncbi:Dabb family protein [Microbacterium sp. 18062]|uniref:Dabb family protein n=1 Tax=Microbacterium sp. 18062 TaxID=2681410 RepID=UPI00135769FF|nr:Dabb family protein [Microbacterium sp. 18062]